MSGKRTKALRRQFRRLYHRSPEIEESRYVSTAARPAVKDVFGLLVLTPEVREQTSIAPGSLNEFRRFRRGIVSLTRAA
jgi:hypothetical protein